MPTPAAPPPTRDEVRIVGLDLGDRLWGKNAAAVTLQGAKDATAQVKFTLTSPRGVKQEIELKAILTAGNLTTVELPYRIDELCTAWNEQYTVELAVTASGKTRTLSTAFGTPSFVARRRGQAISFCFRRKNWSWRPTCRSAGKVSQSFPRSYCRSSIRQARSWPQTVVQDPAGKLPILVPGAETIKHLNIDRCVTMVPDLKVCTIRPWQEATRDYTVAVRLLDRDGKELARAQGIQFGRITHFDPPELKMVKNMTDPKRPRLEPQGKVTVNDEHFLLVDGKPFFPVYFGEYGDTFRFEEGVNITRDQLASLGVNPLLLSAEREDKVRHDEEFRRGRMGPQRHAEPEGGRRGPAIDKMRADHPGKLVVSGYDMISHPGSRRADVAKLFLSRLRHRLHGMQFRRLCAQSQGRLFPRHAGQEMRHPGRLRTLLLPVLRRSALPGVCCR